MAAEELIDLVAAELPEGTHAAADVARNIVAELRANPVVVLRLAAGVLTPKAGDVANGQALYRQLLADGLNAEADRWGKF